MERANFATPGLGTQAAKASGTPPSTVPSKRGFNMLRHLTVSSALTALIVVAGCSSAPEAGDTGDDANITNAPLGPCGATPCNAKNDFEQAKTCDKLFAGHAEIRQPD